jgi:hypothetical protein
MKITATRTASGDLTVAEGSGMQQNNYSTNTTGSDMSTTTSGGNMSTNSTNTSGSSMSTTTTGGNMSSQQTITGTITNISGDTVTVQMPNGQTQDIMVDRALRDRLNLQVGTPITAMMMPDGSMTVSIANGMDQNTTSTNTTGQTQVTRQQTAYTRNYTRYSRNGNQQMTNQSQQTNQVQQDNTSMTGATPANRPVRGMW